MLQKRPVLNLDLPNLRKRHRQKNRRPPKLALKEANKSILMHNVHQRRSFVDENLLIDSFESVEKYMNELLNREISSPEELKKWLKDKSELEAVLEEDMAWRYIKNVHRYAK